MSAVVWRLSAVPLTPIHVGDGSLLAPEDYRLQDGYVERFVASAVLRDMGAAARATYLHLLDAGQLVAAWAELRRAVRPEHVLERIAASGESLRELRLAMDNPERKGELRPFVRSAGRPFLPGSSLKGALRTALLSALAQPHLAELERLKQAAARTARGELRGRASDDMQRRLLRHAATEQDPFRFVHVADVPLPDETTRVDRVVNWRPARERDRGTAPGASEKIQMHYERTISRADGRSPTLGIEIRIDAQGLRATRAMDSAKAPHRDLDPADLRQAINEFHWALWHRELEHFFAGEAATRDRLAKVMTVKLAGRTWRPDEVRADPYFLLLRIGRFGQFESKSVSHIREGWNAQARPPRPMREGTTRNLVTATLRTRDGREIAARVPFGWLLCWGAMA